MDGQIVMTAHIAIEGADSFFAALTKRIDEYQTKKLAVEVQYQPIIQLNGNALFTAVILGREKAIN